MRAKSFGLALLLAVSVAVMGAPVSAQPERDEAGSRPRYVTGPQRGAPADIAVGHLRASAQSQGLTGSDVSDLLVADAYTSRHTGVTHVYVRQRLQQLDVVGANATVNVADDGSIVSLQSRFLPRLAAAARGQARRGAVDAAEAALRGVGLRPTREIRVRRERGGPARETQLTDGGVAEQPITARLVYQPTSDGALRLAWQVEVAEASGDHWWAVAVDAETGAVLDAIDLVDHDDLGAVAAAVAHQDAGEEPAGDHGEAMGGADDDAGTGAAGDGLDAASAGGTYNVYALPFDSPHDGPRSHVVDPADPAASPFGWHDTDGAVGPEFTRTRGNNVHAYTDRDSDGLPDPGSDPDGGPGLVFDFPIDPAQHPHTYGPAAVTNLFYWNNVIHDVFYRYGFDEPAGNFQINNYGHGGVGNDDVRAEAQDGGGLNNANFFTPVDGSRPRMQMFLWNHGRPNVVVVDAPSSAAGTYEASAATFGPAPTVAGTAGPFALADDGEGSPNDACEPLNDFPSGAIAVLDRGACPFVAKVANAQAAGAVAVVVVNNVAGDPVTMGGGDPSITIPSVMVANPRGEALKEGLPATGQVAADPTRSVMRDGDFDNGIIIHEYGHGISNRLTGGPSTAGCLSNQEQMGEGWSDWLAIALTARPGDDGAARRGMGTYALFQPNRTGDGIRPTPYSTDLAVNPATYDDIKTLAVPHGVGYVWATMLWDVYWDLVAKYGFNPDAYAPYDTGGNNLAIQLVMDGMKMQVCRPGFVEGRDAIVAADLALTGGQNACLLSRAFARRGLGFSAVQGSGTSRADNAEAFDLEPMCRAQIGVDPGAVAAAVVEGQQGTAVVTVSNGAALDGEDLVFTVTEAPDDCATPSDVPWLTAGAGGTAAPAASSVVDVDVDTTGFTAPSTVSALLCLSSNDGATPLEIVPVSLQVRYPMSGFAGPIRNAPEVNAARAGATVPVLFSLGGDRGLDILASGSPSSREVACDTLAATGPAQPTQTPGSARLSYNAETDRYTYPWRTMAGWDDTCREFALTLIDGSTTVAYFRFAR